MMLEDKPRYAAQPGCEFAWIIPSMLVSDSLAGERKGSEGGETFKREAAKPKRRRHGNKRRRRRQTNPNSARSEAKTTGRNGNDHLYPIRVNQFVMQKFSVRISQPAGSGRQEPFCPCMCAFVFCAARYHYLQYGSTLVVIWLFCTAGTEIAQSSTVCDWIGSGYSSWERSICKWVIVSCFYFVLPLSFIRPWGDRIEKPQVSPANCQHRVLFSCGTCRTLSFTWEDWKYGCIAIAILFYRCVWAMKKNLPGIRYPVHTHRYVQILRYTDSNLLRLVFTVEQ